MGCGGRYAVLLACAQRAGEQLAKGVEDTMMRKASDACSGELKSMPDSAGVDPTPAESTPV